MKYNFQLMDLKYLKEVYVSSHKRGFMAISGYPSITYKSGCSGTHVIIFVTHVVRKNGKWEYDGYTSIWDKKAWDGDVGLCGMEPWRIYKLNATEVANLLDKGVHVDDIRGFKHRLEPWQPIHLNNKGELVKYVDPKVALCWERTDGWRIVKRGNHWYPDGSHCNADPESTLKYYPNHFEEFDEYTLRGTAQGAMDLVDSERPWD